MQDLHRLAQALRGPPGAVFLYELEGDAHQILINTMTMMMRKRATSPVSAEKTLAAIRIKTSGLRNRRRSVPAMLSSEDFGSYYILRFQPRRK
jgi:hypothetical protein